MHQMKWSAIPVKNTNMLWTSSGLDGMLMYSDEPMAGKEPVPVTDEPVPVTDETVASY